MVLSKVAEKFILHWGEMGTKWGINRTVAQIHALLFLSDRPMHAEEIAETLSVARSNVSTSLRELQGWGIVKASHVLGDRRDHFESMKDIWEMFQVIVDERKRRECDPTMRLLRECLEEMDAGKVAKRDEGMRERLGAMLEFFETMDGWYRQVRSLANTPMRKFFQLGSKMGRLTKWVGGGGSSGSGTT